MQVNVSLPALLCIAGIPPAEGTLTANAALPALQVESSGVSPALIGLTATLPPLAGSLAIGFSLARALPPLAIESQLISGQVGVLARTLPALALFASGGAARDAAVARQLPALRASLDLAAGRLAALSRSLPALRGAATSETGRAGAVVRSLPSLQAAFAAFSETRGVAEGSLPPLRAEMVAHEALAAVFRTWVLNLRKLAVTEYDYEYTSYFQVNGETYGAGGGGIRQLGAGGAEQQVEARILTGQHDFGYTTLKRVPRIYLAGQLGGDMEVITAAEDGARVYTLPHDGVAGRRQRRVPVGRGPKSRYWQFGVRNVDGADFELDSITVLPEFTRRRVFG